MIALTFRCPIGGALHLQGIQGTVQILDGSGPRSKQYLLDPMKALKGDTILIQSRQGNLQHIDQNSRAASRLQIYTTPWLELGHSSLSSGRLTDGSGRAINPPDYAAMISILVSIDGTEFDDGPHAWIGWMVSKSGNTNVTVEGDGRNLKSQTFSARPFDVSRYNDVSIHNPLKLDNHIAGFRNVVVGDVVSLGFRLSELHSVRELSLKVG